MRLFTAIDIPEDLKGALRAFVSRLRPTAKIGWSPLENLHITTKFIGDWPDQRLDEMKIAFHSASLGTTARASELNVIPNNNLQPSRSTTSWALRTQRYA